MCAKHYYPVYCLEVWGPYACFTDPHLKVERVSYPIITPSAAAGIFSTIYWDRPIIWQVEQIDVMAPLKEPLMVTRNETAKLGSLKSNGFFTDDDKVRQQRGSLILRDVKYRIHARQIFLSPCDRPDQKKSEEELRHRSKKERDELARCDNPRKYQAIFERRAKKTQHPKQPYLGCREFSCGFRLIADIKSEPKPIQENRDFGRMFNCWDYSGGAGNAIPKFFHAEMINGVIKVPPIIRVK